MGKYFSINELTYSFKAEKNHIDNSPTELVTSHLNELIAVLDQIREAYENPIIISSGYRCKELNKLVGGVATSAHTVGYAADLIVKDRDIEDFYVFCKKFLTENNIMFDQCIIETSGKTKWVHFGLKNLSGLQRCQFLQLGS